MNEQLQNALAEILGKTIDGIDKSVEFMSAELPDVISQLLTWYAIKGAVELVLGIVLLVSVILFVRWMLKNGKLGVGESNGRHNKQTWTHDEYGWLCPRLLVWLIPCVASLSFGFAFLNIEWLQILITPKIWLIEYASQLVK